MEGVIALFIPIAAFLVIGAVLISYFYFENKTKQILINKGFTAEEIKEILFKKSEGSKNNLLKIGIICIGFGFGLGFGLILEDFSGKGHFIPMFIFVFTGIGFILANHFGKKLA